MSTHTEHEITPKANLIIWIYFFLFVLILFFAISLMTVYFKTEAEYENFVKVGSVKSKELIELRQQEAQELIRIQEAMEKVVRASN
ncbi:MAG: hypothetical protein WCK49_04050 [Myxococcaceae bacterium]